MRELASGLWWWEAVHPEWSPEDAETEDWGPEVSSYAIDDGQRLVLIDPTMPPGPVAELAADRDTAIVLTCPWHGRDTARLAARWGAPVFSPPPDHPGASSLSARPFQAGDELPCGVRAFAGMEPNDLVLWVARVGALAAGDTLIDRGGGLEFPVEWANKGVPASAILETLQPLLALPVTHVLPTHGPPAGRDALQRALTQVTPSA